MEEKRWPKKALTYTPQNRRRKGRLKMVANEQEQHDVYYVPLRNRNVIQVNQWQIIYCKIKHLK